MADAFVVLDVVRHPELFEVALESFTLLREGAIESAVAAHDGADSREAFFLRYGAVVRRYRGESTTGCGCDGESASHAEADDPDATGVDAVAVREPRTGAGDVGRHLTITEVACLAQNARQADRLVAV